MRITAALLIDLERDVVVHVVSLPSAATALRRFRLAATPSAAARGCGCRGQSCRAAASCSDRARHDAPGQSIGIVAGNLGDAVPVRDVERQHLRHAPEIQDGFHAPCRRRCRVLPVGARSISTSSGLPPGQLPSGIGTGKLRDVWPCGPPDLGLGSGSRIWRECRRCAGRSSSRHSVIVLRIHRVTSASTQATGTRYAVLITRTGLGNVPALTWR